MTFNVKQTLTPGNSFCVALFAERYIGQDSDRLCCLDKGSSLTVDQVRQAMLKNEKVSNCSTCYANEASGRVSMRQEKIITFTRNQNKLRGLVEGIDAFINGGPLPLPSRYEIRASNLCNYACIMCSSANSSLIPDANGNLVLLTRALDDLEIPPASFVSLTGGEPQLIKQYLPLLKRLDASCQVAVATNAGVWNSSFLQELKKFQELFIHVSIDNIGELNSKIRIHSKWDTVASNVHRLISEFGANVITINTVIQRDNIANLTEIVNWVNNLGCNWQPIMLHHPRHLHYTHAGPVNIDPQVYDLPLVKNSPRHRVFLKSL